MTDEDRDLTWHIRHAAESMAKCGTSLLCMRESRTAAEMLGTYTYSDMLYYRQSLRKLTSI